MRETELIARAGAGSRDACSELWRRHERFVAGVLLAHMSRETELDDLMQEVAMRVWRAIGQLEDADRFKSWLRQIALSVAVSDGRREGLRRRHRAPVEPATLAEDTRRDVADTLDEVLLRVDSLPDELREPLVLKAIRGLTQKQIAEALNVEETTIETRLARARRLLRACTKECEPRRNAARLENLECLR